MSVKQPKDLPQPVWPVTTRIILRDALVLQGKLVIDGLRDAMLIPVSMIAALIGLLQHGEDRGKFFYEIVEMGRRSERWINLFAAADRIASHEPSDPPVRQGGASAGQSAEVRSQSEWSTASGHAGSKVDDQDPGQSPAGDNVAGLDAYLMQVEERLLRDYQKGEMTRSAREVLSKLTEGIEIARRRFIDASKKDA